jgi:uncharacterized protein
MDTEDPKAALQHAEWKLGADDPDRQVAVDGTILTCIVGSTVHGLAVRDGVEDLDVMGISCEPPERVIGLIPFEQWVGRTKGPGERSEAGDVDSVVYSLRKWSRLALQGNPTVLLPLFVPPDHVLVETPLGAELRAMADAFASRQAGHRFLGYAAAQRERLEGTRGQLRVHRPELVERYGFDTKFAGHLLRLANQGIEYLTTGRLVLPIPDPLGAHLRDVRSGRVSLADVLAEAAHAEARLKDLLDTSPLPEYPDVERVGAFLLRAYRERWGWH